MPASDRAFRPQLEALEDRQLLATKISFDFYQSTMFLDGDKKNNQVVLQHDGTGNLGNITGTVDGKDISLITATRAIRNIQFVGGKGNDRFSLTVVPAFGLQSNSSLTVLANLGEGNDHFAAAIDNVTLLGASYYLQALGGKGNDTLSGTATNTQLLSGSSISFDYQAQDGNDVLRVAADNFFDRATSFSAVLDGGRGNDNISLGHLVQNQSRGFVNLFVRGDYGFDRLDLISRGAGQSNTTVAARIDGGLPSDIGLQTAFPKQWEDITLSGNVELTGIDPRSRITYIPV